MRWGLLAISLPILFHLIRRNPRGRQEFSSLMFLTPSPPRLTKRSRLSNILLLILRALAFLFLAFAFARPFIQQGPDLDTSKSSGRRIAILVDTSASMQRPDLWNQARQQVDKEIADLTAADAVALYAFDRNTRPVLSFDQWNEADPAIARGAVEEPDGRTKANVFSHAPWRCPGHRRRAARRTR